MLNFGHYKSKQRQKEHEARAKEVPDIRKPQVLEQEMTQTSMRIGQIYHEKRCIEQNLEEMTAHLNRLLVEYKTSLEKYPKQPETQNGGDSDIPPQEPA